MTRPGTTAYGPTAAGDADRSARSTPVVARTTYLVVEPDGRIAVPLPLLAAANLRPGDLVGVEADGMSLLVRDPRDILDEVRAAFGPAGEPGGSAVDELIAERRAEAAREEARHREWLARTGGRPPDAEPGTAHDD